MLTCLPMGCLTAFEVAWCNFQVVMLTVLVVWCMCTDLLASGFDWHAGFTDNSSVNVVPTPDGKQLISMTESVAGTYRVDLDLNTLGQLKFQDGVNGLLTTAHPTLLPDGSMINLTSGVRCKQKLATRA